MIVAVKNESCVGFFCDICHAGSGMSRRKRLQRRKGTLSMIHTYSDSFDVNELTLMKCVLV